MVTIREIIIYKNKEKIMWMLLAFGSAIFAGITTILAKCGIQKTDSTVATAMRTTIVLISSWIMVFIVGSQFQMNLISKKSWIFLILSGISTGASWLCYFKALQKGDVNKVISIDKSSVILTILLSFIFLNEEVTIFKMIGMILIGIGTYFMNEKKNISTRQENIRRQWFLYAIGSAIFASLTSILAKVGIHDVESTLGTAIRTSVVLIMAWLMVFLTGKKGLIKSINKKESLFIMMSGLATGASWICYYKALQIGPASVIVPIDKLSILVTVLFSYFVFKERLSKKSLLGLIFITGGTLIMLIS